MAGYHVESYVQLAICNALYISCHTFTMNYLNSYCAVWPVTTFKIMFILQFVNPCLLVAIGLR